MHGASAHEGVKTFFGQEFAQDIGECDINLFLCQLGFELQQEFIHDPHDDDFIKGFEADGGVQTVAKLGGEQALDVRQFVARFASVGKANGRFVHRLSTRIGRHDDDDVAEISFAAVVVRQCAMVHDLKQHIEDVGVGLFNFIQQQNGMGFLGNSFGQQAALVKAHIAGRCAN